MPVATVDFSSPTLLHSPTVVGSGPVLTDNSDSTYILVNGWADTDVSDAATQWIFANLPAIPDYGSLNSITTTVRAKFHSVTTATKGSFDLMVTNRDNGGQFPTQYASYYLQAMDTSFSSVNYVVENLETIFEETFDGPNRAWLSTIGGSDVSHALGLALAAGDALVGFVPRWWFGDPDGSRVSAEVYQISMAIDYNIAPPWPDSAPLVSGHNLAVLPVDEGLTRPYHPAWWVFTPDTTQSLTLDTFSTLADVLTDADTLIYVYQGANPDVATTVAFNDDASIPPNNLLSRLTFTATAGTTYHIRVGSYDTSGDGITTYDLNAPFVGANTSDGGGGPSTQDTGDAFFNRRGSFW